MTEDDKTLVEAMKDAVLHGAGFLKNGKHVPIDDVYLDPRDARIEALSAENARLQRSAEYWEQDARRYAGNVDYWKAENARLQKQYDEMGNTMLKYIGINAAEIVRLELENDGLKAENERLANEIADRRLGSTINGKTIKALVSENKKMREAIENAVEEIETGWSLNARDILEAALGEKK